MSEIHHKKGLVMFHSLPFGQWFRTTINFWVHIFAIPHVRRCDINTWPRKRLGTDDPPPYFRHAFDEHFEITVPMVWYHSNTDGSNPSKIGTTKIDQSMTKRWVVTAFVDRSMRTSNIRVSTSRVGMDGIHRCRIIATKRYNFLHK